MSAATSCVPVQTGQSNCAGEHSPPHSGQIQLVMSVLSTFSELDHLGQST
jgi:hypothetical protein